MWEPDAGWQRLSGGMGTSTVGVWLAEVDGRELVVKRIAAPHPGEPAELSDRRHFAWWRRPVEVATSQVVDATPGLRGTSVIRVEEDDEGVTLWHPRVVEVDLTGPYVARALGRFAGAELGDRDWLARDQLSDRLARTEHRGGWRTLERTTVADVADVLWRRRARHLQTLAELPQVAQHGDPAGGNLPGREGEDVIAVDWSTLGTGPVGGDLGYWALQAKEDFEVLLEAYVDGLPPWMSAADARSGAQITAVYTALSRAEWALARVARTPGALAGKYRHPSVAPYLRSLQRQFPQIEALI